jgi:outer membrane protein TolC
VVKEFWQTLRVVLGVRGSIDEPGKIRQYPPQMRLNFPSWIVLLCFVPAVHAQLTETKPTTRPMSLDDCIRLALERNLSIQIGDRVALGSTADLDVRSGGRIGLEEQRLTLARRYSYYDPGFEMSFGQNYNNQPGSTDPTTGIARPGRERWTEEFGSGIAGKLPTGADYRFGVGMTRLSGGRSRDIDTNSPTFGRVFDDPFQYSSDIGISVTQPFLRDFWIDRGRVDIKLAKITLKRSEWDFRLLVMDIVQRVAAAYYDFLAARDQIKVREKALELAEQLVAENKKKVQVGTLAPLDERQAEAQAATAKSDLTTAIFTAQQAENMLKGLITHEFKDIQPVGIEPTEKLVAVYQQLSLAESWRTGLEKRPDYLLEKQDLENRQISLQFYRNQLFPRLDLNATYGRNGLGVTTSDSLETIDNNRFPRYGASITLSFPLSFRNERNLYKVAKLEQQAAILSLKRREDEVLNEIDIAVKEVASRYQTTQSTRQARIFAEEALDAEQKKLENGKSTSFQVLQFQRDLTSASSAEIQAIADYNKALHLFYFREGTTLERNKITLELK